MKFYKANLFIAASLMIIFSVGCKENKPGNDSLRTVILTHPSPINGSSSEEYSGIIEEGKSVNASFMADGKINRLLVKEGDRVKKGQLIASLDDSDYQIGVNQLKTQFHQMTEEKKRMDEMFARHNIAPNDYEKFTAGYEQLRLQVEMAENKLGYTNLYSPTDGYISEKFMEPGELVGAGTPVYKITDDSSLIASLDLPVEMYIHRNNIVSTVGFSPVFQDNSIPLGIESFTPNPSNNMLYQMKLNIPQKYAGNLSPGMNIRVDITVNEGGTEGYEIPSRAILKENETTYVWVFNVSDSTITKKAVNVVGTPVDKKITVSGLSGQEAIVETGVKQLYEGEKVNVAKNSDYSL
ncbi:MAG: efflux RND transporter periplasmic adaptor subunit [Muribaculaceae bacterium]|nr:efflux RND transporter periplasmic adaptor subunit [Muribaculaceae bacterium]